MLLNKITCLDRGYVALIDSSCDTAKLNEVAIEFFKKDDSRFLREIATLTLVIKCPLFVQLHLSTYDLNIISTPVDEIEAYCPNVGEIGGKDVHTNKGIADNMKAASDALLINPRAYQEDGCDRFVSQVLTPISTYTTLIVHGPYNEWKKFCEQPKLPAPIKAYVKAVTQIANVEWR
jgi:hypothetical protein